MVQAWAAPTKGGSSWTVNRAPRPLHQHLPDVDRHLFDSGMCHNVVVIPSDRLLCCLEMARSTLTSIDAGCCHHGGCHDRFAPRTESLVDEL